MAPKVVRLSALLVLTVAGCAAPSSRDVHFESDPPAATPRHVSREPAQSTQLVTHQEEVPRQRSELFAGPTSVEDLVSYAVSNNPRIVAARSKAEALISRIPQARSLDDPMLSTTVFLEEIQTAAGPQEVMLSLSQKFPWFGKRTARGEIAYHDAQIAYAELAVVELGVIEGVKLAWYELYFIHESLRVYKDLEPAIKDVIASTQTRFQTNDPNVGLESVLQAKIALHKLQITMAELEQAAVKATARLAQALHLPEGTGLDIEPQLARSTLPQQVESLVAMIEYCHPQLDARREAIHRDDWSIALAHKNYFPDVSLGFNWNAIGERGLSAVANGRDAYSLMIGVNLPIYKGRRDAALREAQFRTAQSAQEYEAAWDALRADVQELYAKAVEHDRILQILNSDILRKSQQAFELSIEAYRVNRIGFQQLMDNYESLLRFRIAHHLRRARREQAIASLERAVGCAVTEW